MTSVIVGGTDLEQVLNDRLTGGKLTEELEKPEHQVGLGTRQTDREKSLREEDCPAWRGRVGPVEEDQVQDLDHHLARRTLQVSFTRLASLSVLVLDHRAFVSMVLLSTNYLFFLELDLSTYIQQ